MDTHRSTSDHAVDGNTNGNFFSLSCTHTAPDNVGNPWWAVDMQQEECVGLVVLYNRADCCPERLAGAIVRVGSNPEYGQNPACMNRVPASPDERIEIACYKSGQYISVELPGSGVLTLCEVEATSCSGNDKTDKRFWTHFVNVAANLGTPSEISLIGKPTSQSSTMDTHRSTSDHAVDGNTNGNFFLSLLHTYST
ncbi:fucolectin-like [Amphiura filiformis]|uniref:fucolectin-like n=1 Tax=Amphiura filiformis TaxID=82378 RepID=UPI003B2150C7